MNIGYESRYNRLSERTRALLASEELRRFLFCMILTFAWGFAAHAYGLFQDSFTHDSLNALHANAVEQAWKMQLGRIFVPVYQKLVRGSVALPWLIGILALVWIGMSVYLTVRMLKIRSGLLIALTAGIFTTNLSVSATVATYIHDLDVNMFALLAATLAACLWKRDSIGSLMLGALSAVVSLCLYQSFISMTIVLIMFASIFALLDQDSFTDVMKRGLKGLGMLASAALIYLLLLKLTGASANLSMDTGTSNSMSNAFTLNAKSLLTGVVRAYLGWGYVLLKAETAYPPVLMAALRLLLFLGTAAGMLLMLFKGKKYGGRVRLLALVLCALLPLGMNFACLLTQSIFHYLMVFAVWLTYLLVLMLAFRAADHPGKHPRRSTWLKRICVAMAALMLWGNVQASNSMYLKKDLEEEATLSLMTRVLYRMEEREDYVPGETPVAFFGLSELIEPLPGMDAYADMVGMEFSSPISVAVSEPYFNVYDAYFKYVLRNPAAIADHETWTALQADARVAGMPAYPAEGCMQSIDGVLVVKMGESAARVSGG